jgi:hypothetical protein
LENSVSKFEFLFLENDQKHEIVKLRKSAFNDAYPNHVDLTGLEWNLTDENSIHLGFKVEKELVSCLRVSTFTNFTKLERNTLFKTPANIATPCILLSRAATLKKYENCSLHSKLRFYALELALHYGITCVLGSLEKRSPRLQSLLQSGYEILASQEKWEGSYLKNSGPVLLIGIISSSSIIRSLKYFKNKHHLQDISEFPKLRIIS